MKKKRKRKRKPSASAPVNDHDDPKSAPDHAQDQRIATMTTVEVAKVAIVVAVEEDREVKVDKAAMTEAKEDKEDMLEEVVGTAAHQMMI